MTTKTYTQKEFDAAVEEAYARGRDDGYESALDSVYDNEN